MATEKYILVRQYSEHSRIEPDFIQSLFEYELVFPEERDDEMFIDENDINEIEKMFRLHRDLGLNYEGLGAVNEMLNRIHELQQEMEKLRKRLRLYES